jgi:hypothetical protein
MRRETRPHRRHVRLVRENQVTFEQRLAYVQALDGACAMAAHVRRFGHGRSGGRTRPQGDVLGAKVLARSTASITSAERNWRAAKSAFVLRLLPKLDVAGSSPVARSLKGSADPPGTRAGAPAAPGAFASGPQRGPQAPFPAIEVRRQQCACRLTGFSIPLGAGTERSLRLTIREVGAGRMMQRQSWSAVPCDLALTGRLLYLAKYFRPSHP